MHISLIVAMDRARGIGVAGGLPWRLSADLQFFKQTTLGHTLIQGRRTWEAIGRPLPGRRMVVVTRRQGYSVPDGVHVCGSLEAALDLARAAGDDEAFVGGGAGLFAAALPLADRIYLTRVDAETRSDTFFPDFDETAWTRRLLFEHPEDERNQYAFRVELLERAAAGAFTDAITFLPTRDLTATAAFYEEVLGLPLVVDQGTCRIYRAAAAAYLGFCERTAVPEPPEAVILTLVTERVDDWAVRLRAAGVSFEKEPALNPLYGIYHAFFRDPNGYLLEIQTFLDPNWRGV